MMRVETTVLWNMPQWTIYSTTEIISTSSDGTIYHSNYDSTKNVPTREGGQYEALRAYFRNLAVEAWVSGVDKITFNFCNHHYPIEFYIGEDRRLNKPVSRQEYGRRKGDKRR